MPSTYTPIATYTVSGSSTSTISFTGISGTYTDLILVSQIRGNYAATSDYLLLRVNSDSGSNYSSTDLSGYGSSAGSGRTTSTTYFSPSYFPAATAAAGEYAVCITNLQNYSNATTNKTFLARNNYASAATQAIVGLWRSTSAITRIDLTTYFSSTFNAGSTFTLYGVKSA